MARLRYLADITSLALDVQTCIGCGRCAEVCPHGVFVVERRASIRDRDACMECGACARNCPVSAIRVRAGVGCATALLKAALSGDEPSCGDSADLCCR